MITCPNCGKENQDHYKFCLGCGSKLPQVGSVAPSPPPQRPAAPPPPPPPPSPSASRATAAPANPMVPGGAPSGPIGAPRSQVPLTPPPPAGPPVGGPPFGAPGPVMPQPPLPQQPMPQQPMPQPPMPQPPMPQPPMPQQPMPQPPMPQPPMPQPPMPQQATPQAPAPSAALPMQFGAPEPTAAAGVCSQCSFQSPPGFAFCGRCGTPLAAPAPATPPPDVGSAQTVFVGNARDLAMASTGVMDAVPPIVEEPPPAPQAPAELGVAAPVVVVGSSGTAPGSGLGPSPIPASPGVPVRLVMLGPDGQPIGERVLAAGEAIDVGRDAGPPWDDDAYLDPRHATMLAAEAGVLIEDHGSLNGVFVKLTQRTELRTGDQFRVGQELLAYEELPEPTPTEDGTERMGSPNPGYWGRVSILVDPAMAASAFAIAGEGIGIGREVGEITFPQDGYVSGRHCRIIGDDNGIYLEDLGSSNGTYMRVRTGQVVPFGSLVLIGQKLFQLERA